MRQFVALVIRGKPSCRPCASERPQRRMRHRQRSRPSPFAGSDRRTSTVMMMAGPLAKPPLLHLSSEFQKSNDASDSRSTALLGVEFKLNQVLVTRATHSSVALPQAPSCGSGAAVAAVCNQAHLQRGLTCRSNRSANGRPPCPRGFRFLSSATRARRPAAVARLALR